MATTYQSSYKEQIAKYNYCQYFQLYGSYKKFSLDQQSSTDCLIFSNIQTVPATVVHVYLWIEEDLVYTNVCQAFGLITLVAVSLAGGDQLFQMAVGPRSYK